MNPMTVLIFFSLFWFNLIWLSLILIYPITNQIRCRNYHFARVRLNIPGKASYNEGLIFFVFFLFFCAGVSWTTCILGVGLDFEHRDIQAFLTLDFKLWALFLDCCLALAGRCCCLEVRAAELSDRWQRWSCREHRSDWCKICLWDLR